MLKPIIDRSTGDISCSCSYKHIGMFGKSFKEKVLSVFGTEVFFRCEICVRLCLICGPWSGGPVRGPALAIALADKRCLRHIMPHCKRPQSTPLFVLFPHRFPISHAFLPIGLVVWSSTRCH